MRFGDLPSWAVELSTLIREAICVGHVDVDVGAEINEDEDACPLPSDLLWREPFFDQMIANRYNPGEVRNILFFWTILTAIALLHVPKQKLALRN